jgi:hypothetical protein
MGVFRTAAAAIVVITAAPVVAKVQLLARCTCSGRTQDAISSAN